MEAFAATLAAGARWGVLAMVAALALSGAGLALVEDDPPGGWWALVALKTSLLLVALAIFAWVSWRLWPARLFAGADELPDVRRRFRLAAYSLTGLVAAEVVLGVAADALR